MYNKELVGFCVETFKKAVDSGLTDDLSFKIIKMRKKEIMDLIHYEYNGWRLEKSKECDQNSIILCPINSN